MWIQNMLLALASVLVVGTTTVAADESTGPKAYECGGEEMKLTALPDGRLELKGETLTGHVLVSVTAGVFLAKVMVAKEGGSLHRTPQEAIARLCEEIQRRSKPELVDGLRKELQEFYASVKQPERATVPHAPVTD